MSAVSTPVGPPIAQPLAVRPPVIALAALVVGALAGAARGTPPITVEGMFPAGRSTVTVGPAPAGTGSADAAACATCHAEIAAEWRSSMHAASWTDEVFQAAYAVEPMAFCRNCHAPSHTGAVPRGVAADDGVSCAVCHVRDEHVLASRRSPAAPHPVMAVRAMSGSGFCAGCHQFNFPGDTGRGGAHFETGEPMQDTYAEWLDSAAAADGVACQGCHMPMVDGPRGRHRSHRFPGGRDLSLLRSAVEVTATARAVGDRTVVTFTLTPRTLGHSFPTGDLFRRVEVTAAWDSDPASTVRVGLAREFANVPARAPHGGITFVRRQSADTRLAAAGLGAPRVLTLTLPGHPPSGRVRWSLDHLLMPTPLAASQGVGEPRNRLVVADGTIDPTPGDTTP